MADSPLAWDDFRLVKAIAEARGLAGAAERLGRQPLDGVPPPRPDRGAARASSSSSATAPATRSTTAGEEMAALAERIDDDVAAFARKLAGQAISPAGELRVTTNDTLLVHLLTPLLRRLLRQLPGRAARRGLRQPGAEPLEARRRRRDPRHRQPARDARRPPRRDDRLGALRPRRGFPAGPAASISSSLYERPWVALGDNFGGVKAARFVRERVAPEQHRLQGQHRARPRRGGRGRHRHRPPALLHRRPAPGAGAPVAAEPGLLDRPLAPDPSRPAPIGAGPRVPRFHRRRDRQAAAG